MVIYFYLDDDTIEIIEPKITNSGITQGCFLKRQKILKSGNSTEFLQVEDI